MKNKTNKHFFACILSAAMVFSAVSAAYAESGNDFDGRGYCKGVESYLYSSGEIIPVNHNNTIADIVEKARLYKHYGFERHETRYEEIPNLKAPYSAGSLNQSDIADAENAVKMVRFLAGVPYENVRLDPELNNIAQHGAVLLAASNQFSHNPNQPSDMSDDFYSLANRGCSEANIFWGINNISYGVIGWMYDEGENNISRAGHRRWIMNPGNQNFGIGYADGNANMHVFDGLSSWDCESDSYIAWPAAADFPIEYFAANDYIEGYIYAPWSINLGAKYNEPDKNSVVLKLTRKRDGKVWTFDKNTPDLSMGGYGDYSKLHLAVDNGGYGIRKAIVFRPDLDSLGQIKDGDVFNVDLTGIQGVNGSPEELTYDINFFSLSDIMTKTEVTIHTQYNGKPVANVNVRIDDKDVISDSDGNAVVKLKAGESYSYTVSKDGYGTAEGTLSVKSGPMTYNVNLSVPVRFTISNTNKTYNGAAEGVTVSASPNAAYKVTYNGYDTIPRNAGEYDVSVVSTEEGYSGSAEAKLIISKAVISVNADNKSKTVNAADPSLTYSIVSGQLYGSDTITGSLIRNSGETAGTYMIDKGTLSAGSNYIINVNPGIFSIIGNSSGASGTNGGSSGSNYFNNYAADSESNKIILTIGKKEARVFGESIFNDVAPKIVNDRTMLPARFVAESLGAEVEWDSENYEVIIRRYDVTIYIPINSSIAFVNGELVELDSPAFIEDERTYTPIRFICEALNANVDWDEAEQNVIISTK